MAVNLTNVKVTYSVDATINVGNFENVKPHFSITADVEDGGNPKEAFLKIKGLCDALLAEEYAATKARL